MSPVREQITSPCPPLQVLQYKKRCGDLEQTLVEKSSELELHRLSVRTALHHYGDILKQLTMPFSNSIEIIYNSHRMRNCDSYFPLGSLCYVQQQSPWRRGGSMRRPGKCSDPVGGGAAKVSDCNLPGPISNETNDVQNSMQLMQCRVMLHRSSSLSAVNAMLREQLEQAELANEALSQDIRRLTADWSKSREELEQRESDWRREEEVGIRNEFLWMAVFIFYIRNTFLIFCHMHFTIFLLVFPQLFQQ